MDRKRAFENYSIVTVKRAAILRIGSFEFCKVFFEATLASQNTKRKVSGNYRSKRKSLKLKLCRWGASSGLDSNKRRDGTPSTTQLKKDQEQARKYRLMSIQQRVITLNLKESSIKISVNKLRNAIVTLIAISLVIITKTQITILSQKPKIVAAR